MIILFKINYGNSINRDMHKKWHCHIHDIISLMNMESLMVMTCFICVKCHLDIFLFSNATWDCLKWPCYDNLSLSRKHSHKHSTVGLTFGTTVREYIISMYLALISAPLKVYWDQSPKKQSKSLYVYTCIAIKADCDLIVICVWDNLSIDQCVQCWQTF